MNQILLLILVFAVCGWIGRLEAFKIREEKRAKTELAFLKDVYNKIDDEDEKEILIMIAESLIDKEYRLVKTTDEDTATWWREKIKVSGDKFAHGIKMLADMAESAKK